MSKKKRMIGIAAFLGTLALLAAAAVGILFLMLKSRADAFSEGFSFEAEYRITTQEQSGQGLLPLFLAAGWEEGRLSGEMEGDILHFELYPNEETEAATEIYCSDGTLLFDIKRIYERQREKIGEKVPLAGRLLPDWSFGTYISSALLGEAVGLDLRPMFFADTNALSPKRFTRIRYEEGKSEMLYFRLNLEEAEAEGYEIIAGIDRHTLLRGPVMCDVMIKKDRQELFLLTVTAWPDSGAALSMPEDVVTREDIEWLISLRKLIEKAVEIL